MEPEDRKLLIEAIRSIAGQAVRLDGLTCRIEGVVDRLEGKDGLIREFDILKASHQACQEEKKRIREEQVIKSDTDLKKAVAVASIVATLITTLIGKFL